MYVFCCYGKHLPSTVMSSLQMTMDQMLESTTKMLLNHNLRVYVFHLSP